MTGGLTQPLDILSVAPRYSAGADGAQAGHYTIYQDDLRAAAARLGHRMVTLAGRTSPAGEGVVTCLDTTDEWTIASSAAGRAREGDLIVCYEGSLAIMDAFAVMAVERPDVTFLVNLFRPEAGLIPDRSKGEARTSRSKVAFPDNLLVSAETDLRVDFARQLGVPCVGSWRLHSTLWDVEVPSGEGRDASGPVRVLIPLAARGYCPAIVHDVAYVMRRLRRLRGDVAVEWTLTGATSGKFSAQVRGARLEALGAQRVDAPPDREGYAALFARHDVGWIPNRTSYQSQSSGKALDALVTGLPVISAAGSWPAREASRWLGEDLSYLAPEGAVDVFSDLASDPHRWRAPLAAAAWHIRRAYAPESTVLRILEFCRSGTKMAEKAGSVPLMVGWSMLEPLPDVCRPRARATKAGSSGTSRMRRAADGLLAARTARIGFGLRTRRRLMRSAWRFRERFRAPR